jgi:hypothetical protein
MKRKISIWKCILNEIRFRKMNFILSVVSVFIASSALIASIVALRIHDEHTGIILEEKEKILSERMAALEDDTRKAMLELGFNIVILPGDQQLSDWYDRGYGTQYMPEDYVNRLAESGIIIVRHFFPTLQQKIDWPEKRRKIILVGTRGEVPNPVKGPREPLIEPVPEGFITLGYELHRSMDLKPGQNLTLMGKEFVVNECYEERGTQDDISAWIHLREAQELLGKPQLINAIQALECLCTGDVPLYKLREEITGILPGTQVIEQGGKALARAEARLKLAEQARATIEAEKQNRETLRGTREDFASFLVPVILLACGIWIAFLGLMNSRTRRSEIGIFRAFGIPAKDIMKIFLNKYFLVGICGGILGYFGGMILGIVFGNAMEGRYIWIFSGFNQLLYLFLLSVAGSSILAVIAGWIPALVAARQDPAEILHSE